jgi:ferredoxin
MAADVPLADERGDGALHVASAIGRLDAAHVLLEAGAPTDVRNKQRRSSRRCGACAARAPVAAVRSRHAAAPPRCYAQVCVAAVNKAARAAPLAAVTPWFRHRPVACGGCVLEWEALEDGHGTGAHRQQRGWWWWWWWGGGGEGG